MKIGRIAHAGIVVQTREVTCLMDPVLFNRIENDSFGLDPEIALDRRALKALRPDAVLISHDHCDHFSLRSLDLLSRDIQVIFPSGAFIIESCMRRMGFRNFRTLSIGETTRIGDLEMTATPSAVDFVEMGVVFESRGLTCWNQVDTRVSAAIVSRLKKRFGKIDLLLATFQPLIQDELWQDALGASFPTEIYLSFLNSVARTAPRYVVPTAYAWRNSVAHWINDRAFPVTESRFLSDVHRIAPRTRGVRLAPGDVIDLARGGRVLKRRLAFVSPSRKKPQRLEWRPDRGVPAFRDPNPLGLSRSALQKEVRRYLNGDFLLILHRFRNDDWLKKLRRKELIWNLDVVFPGGAVESKRLNFGKARLSWDNSPDPHSWDIRTTIAASAVCGMLTGSLTLFRVYHADMVRCTFRLYDLSPKAATESKVPRLDPLTRVLDQFHKERCLNYQLTELGY